MPIISVKDNKNNRWKRNPKKQTNKQTNNDRKEQRATEAIVKGWELNYFVVLLS